MPTVVQDVSGDSALQTAIAALKAKIEGAEESSDIAQAISQINTALGNKQNKLTFDSTPTASSTNPVTSGGVKTALDSKQDTLRFDNEPTAESTNPVTSGGIKAALDEQYHELNDRLVVAEEVIDIRASGIYDTASGSIVSLTDGADNLPMKSCVVTMEPIQDLHGYDSPWPAGGGKNLFNPDDAQNNKWINGDTGAIESVNGYWVTGFIPVKSGDAIRCPLKGSARSAWYNSDKTSSTYVAYGGGSASITAPADGFFITAVANSTVAFGSDFIVTINNSDLTYAPYSNICPISGRTGLSVVRNGKNLLPNNAQTVTKGGLTFTVNADGSIHIVGTGTGAVANRKIDLPVSLKDGETYTASGINSVSTDCRIYLQDASGNATPSSYFSSGEKTFTKSASNNVGMYRIWVAENATVDTAIYPMIRLASDTDATDYEPYKGSTYSVNWETEAGSIYGGYVDVVSGKLTVNRAIADLGNTYWNRDTNRPGVFYGAIAGRKSNTKIVNCSSYKPNNVNVTTNIDYYISSGVSYGGMSIFVRDTRYAESTPVEFKEGVTGVKAVYELATPTEIQLTPQEIRTLLGENNIWSDAGDMVAEYPADTKMYIDNKIAEAIAAALA